MAYSREELEKAGLGRFVVFLAMVWLFLRLPKPTPVQLNIANYLQTGPKRLVIEAFRGVGKSWITVAFVLWVLLLDPQKKVMVVSAGESLASDFTKFAKQLIYGMPLLKHLKPEGDQRSRGDGFDVGPSLPAKDASLYSVGLTGQMAGHRADLIIADDIEIPKNSMTQLMRDRMSEQVKEFDALLTSRPISDPARIIYLGTPQCSDSLYTKLPAAGYEVRIWTAEVPERPQAYGGRLAPFVVDLINRGVPPGTPVDPKRFNREELDQRALSYNSGGKAGYALQYMLDTTPADQGKHPLKLKDLMVFDLDSRQAPIEFVWGNDKSIMLDDLQAAGLEGDRYYRPAFFSKEMARYTQTVMAIDPSGKGKDETAYAIVKYMHGNLFLVDSGGFVDGFGEATMKALAGRALRWGVNDIIIERNYGGGMFDSLFKPVLAKAFKEAIEQEEAKAKLLGREAEKQNLGKIDEEWKSWSSASKENRIIDILAPVMENHRLIVNRTVIEQDLPLDQYGHFAGEISYSLIHQLTRIFRMKGALVHDDRADALAMAVSYFTSKMDRDQKRAHSAHLDKLRDKELKDFINSFDKKPGNKKRKYMKV